MRKKQGIDNFDKNQNDDNPFQAGTFTVIQNVREKFEVVFDDAEAIIQIFETGVDFKIGF